MADVCNPREVHANDTSGELGSAFQGSLVVYYWFIVRFPIGLDFLFLTFLLLLLLSWTSSLPIPSSAISASTLSNDVFLGLPTGLLPSTLYSIHFFAQSSTFSHHMSIPSQSTTSKKVVIGSTPTSLLNSSFVLLSFNEIPYIPFPISLFLCIHVEDEIDSLLGTTL